MAWICALEGKHCRLLGSGTGFVNSVIRWDTPQHVLTDDTADTDKAQIWPGMLLLSLTIEPISNMSLCLGKDYSNPRIADFSNLNKPEEDMYDRTKVARMPWYANANKEFIFWLMLTISCLKQGMMLQCKSSGSLREIWPVISYRGEPKPPLLRCLMISTY